MPLRWHRRPTARTWCLVSADLTPDDLAALRVRLADLPGFDPRGLDVYVLGDEEDEPHLARLRGEKGSLLLADDRVVSEEDAWVTTADSATRDRLARWCVVRQPSLYGLVDEVLCTAPLWGRAGSRERPTWVLSVHGRGQVWSAEWRAGTEEAVPALAGLPCDPGWAEWAALAAVARHLGVDRG